MITVFFIAAVALTWFGLDNAVKFLNKTAKKVFITQSIYGVTSIVLTSIAIWLLYQEGLFLFVEQLMLFMLFATIAINLASLAVLINLSLDFLKNPVLILAEKHIDKFISTRPLFHVTTFSLIVDYQSKKEADLYFRSKKDFNRLKGLFNLTGDFNFDKDFSVSMESTEIETLLLQNKVYFFVDKHVDKHVDKEI